MDKAALKRRPVDVRSLGSPRAKSLERRFHVPECRKEHIWEFNYVEWCFREFRDRIFNFDPHSSQCYPFS